MLIYWSQSFALTMFKDYLEDEEDIYVMTGSSFESVWGAYCFPGNFIQEEDPGTCLATQFSVGWTEFLDEQDDPCEVSVIEMVHQTKEAIQKSTVGVVGSEKIGQQAVGNFIGTCDNEFTEKEIHDSIQKSYVSVISENGFNVIDAEIKFYGQQNRMHYNQDNNDLIIDLFEERIRVNHRFYRFRHANEEMFVDNEGPLLDDSCFQKLLGIYHLTCGYSVHELENLNVFNSLCNSEESRSYIENLAGSLCEGEVKEESDAE